MKKIFIILQLFTLFAAAQENEILKLENSKNQLIKKVSQLNDSIKKIDLEIIFVESNKVKKIISESSVVALANKGATLKKEPKIFSDVILTFNEDKQVTILDYHNGYFGVCADSICGYLNDVWIKKDAIISEIIRKKNDEEQALSRLESEREIKTQKEDIVNLEKSHITKWGKTNYEKLKKGLYWIGMTREMVIFSLGWANDINRTVGYFGVHEQWVYENLYLYFENGILTTYQKHL